jgi:hypothetical protein
VTHTRLNRERRRKVARIKAALAKSGHGLRAALVKLDQAESSARQDSTTVVGSPTASALDVLQRELRATQVRLIKLNTGLRAEIKYREALALSFQAVGHWRDGVSSSDPTVVAQSSAKMRREFEAAQLARNHAVDALARGR